MFVKKYSPMDRVSASTFPEWRGGKTTKIKPERKKKTKKHPYFYHSLCCESLLIWPGSSNMSHFFFSPLPEDLSFKNSLSPPVWPRAKVVGSRWVLWLL